MHAAHGRAHLLEQGPFASHLATDKVAQGPRDGDGDGGGEADALDAHINGSALAAVKGDRMRNGDGHLLVGVCARCTCGHRDGPHDLVDGLRIG